MSDAVIFSTSAAGLGKMNEIRLCMPDKIWRIPYLPDTLENRVQADVSELTPELGLGIDAGGTQTRWALANPQQQIVANGTAAGMSALQLEHEQGELTLRHLLSALAATAASHGRVGHIRAGITGYGGDMQALPALIAEIFELPEAAISISNDITIAYQDIFKPGEGYLIYAGTGSIAAYIDQDGEFHRAGGRGFLLDDGGGGFWIAREALRAIWRQEDLAPGSWQTSVLAQQMFQMMGGSDWDSNRSFIYQLNRGEIGKLALAVARAANNQDLQAQSILRQAGEELARLGLAMCQRFGVKPIALGGRVQDLHPLIVESLRATLPATISFRQSTCRAHFSAARLAARSL